MEGLIFACKTRTPITTPPTSELSPKPFKPKLSFNKTHQTIPTTPDPILTDAQLNSLCRNGQLREAIAALDSVVNHGFKVRPQTLTRLIQSCIDTNSLHLGRKIHTHIDLLTDTDPYMETKLVSMYSKCGSFEDARKVFDEMRDRNLYSWAAIIGACSREKRWREVIDLFFSMMEDCVVPDDFLFMKILWACGYCEDFETTKLIHSIVIRCGFVWNVSVSNSILSVYVKCRNLRYARRFFESMETKNQVSWNSIVIGYCQMGEIVEARRLFDLMREEGIEPDLITWNVLITTYNRLGNFDLALKMMNEMKNLGITRDVFTWTSIISGCARNKREIQALELLREMVLEGIEPNEITIMNAISVCTSLTDLSKGKELHSLAVKLGFSENVLVGNSLISLYSKFREVEAAQRVFDLILEKDLYTWNSMISGYCQAGYCGKAHYLFVKMWELDFKPDVVTWNTMITGYMQKGDEDQAMDLFQRMEKDGYIKRDTASWNSMIAGYLKHGDKHKALGMFRQMQYCNFRPNAVTILSVLPACANLIAAKKVKEIHGCVLRSNLELELSVLNYLIDTYAKCGNIVYSRTIFQRMSNRDIITWNTMFAGSVLHGFSYTALELFDQMRTFGLKPNRGTFVSIISAYGLNGLVDEGKQVFASMPEVYYILPGLEHYIAMIDLLGRSGRLEEAFEFVERIGLEPAFPIWDALLTACRIHGNVRLAIRAGERLLELVPGNVIIQRLVLQTYDLFGDSDNCLKLKFGKKNGNKESLGLSWIEVENKVYSFVAGDKSKPNAEILFAWVKSVSENMERPDSHAGLDIEEEEKEEVGGVHSEKLAIAFALVGSSKASSRCIRIVKNVRMCSDCHRTAKFISKTYGCEIFLSDTKCLHHFKNGQCSCKDYW